MRQKYTYTTKLQQHLRQITPVEEEQLLRLAVEKHKRLISLQLHAQQHRANNRNNQSYKIFTYFHRFLLYIRYLCDGHLSAGILLRL